MNARDILTLRPEGLYCPAGNFFIDPTRAVPRAVITHGHADHARAGHQSVLATPETLAIMAARYGKKFTPSPQPQKYGETLQIGDVTLRLHPAGHVLGSAQIAITGKSGTIVVSGDYKRQSDPTCALFEPVRCNIFITEATFALPIFRMPPAEDEIRKLINSTQVFPEKTHLVGCYSLGKAQRVAALIRKAGWNRPLYMHDAVDKITQLYVDHGVDFGETRKVSGANKADLAGEIVICPPTSLGDAWASDIPDPIACFASGWMRIRAHARRRGIELPLAISDHADWDDLTNTILETGCEEVWITHGEADALMHWASLRQLRAMPLKMIGYSSDDGEDTTEVEAL